MAIELAKAYVQIIPSTEGIAGKLSEAMGAEADAAGKSAGSRLSGALSGGLSEIAKVGVAAMGAAAAGVSALTKSAVDGFADYEQLVGGVETLFKENADTVQSYAANAYKTAGLSANEYLETVTGFSASLLQSLGGDTEQAAHVADMAISDMADNANKMGTAMESIRNAYQGFAKQNYTMLDNLKLGYGGTKAEMERLLADAQALSGVNYDLESLKDVYEAIHVIQDALGVTGTTAKEAGETISGSIASMKGAWENLLVGFADGTADLEKRIGSLVETAETAFGNLLPVIEQALLGIAGFVEQIAPVVAEKLPEMVGQLLPPLLNAAGTLIGSLAEALPSMLQVLADMAPTLVTSFCDAILTMLPAVAEIGLDLVVALAKGIGDSLPELIPAAVEMMTEIVETLTRPDTLSGLVDAALAIITGLAQGLIQALPVLVEHVPTIISNIVETLAENIPKIVEAGVELFTALVGNLPDIILGIVTAIPEIIAGIVGGVLKGVPDLAEAGIELFCALVQKIGEIIAGITAVIPTIIAAILNGIAPLAEELAEFFTKVWEGIRSVFSGAGEWFGKKFSEAKEKAVSAWNNVKEKFSGVWKSIRQAFKLDEAKEWGRQLLSNFKKGLEEKVASLKEGLKSIGNTIRDFLGFSEPEKGPLSDFHTYSPDMMELFAQGIRDNAGLIQEQLIRSFDFRELLAKLFYAAWEAVQGVFANSGEVFHSAFGTALDAAKQVCAEIPKLFSAMWGSVAKKAGTALSGLSGQLSSALAQEITGNLNRGAVIPQYASGGFPEDGLFLANHNELVGRFSNGKTAVANNRQITDGIAQAVETANERELDVFCQLLDYVRQIAARDGSIRIGDDVIGRSYDRYAANRGSRVSRGTFANAY